MNEVIDKVSGKTKELAGRVTRNQKLEYKGRLQYDMAHLKD